MNRFVKDVCNKYNIRTVHGRPYHPQSQGQVENLNRRVKNCLRHFLLSYTEDQRAEVWPSLVKDIEYFINHSWYHTVRSVPYNVFLGRFQTRNMGKVPPQPEFMEEYFLLDNNVMENELEFELNIADSGVVSLPNYEHDNDVRVRLAHMQTFQEQQKHDVFEATEANSPFSCCPYINMTHSMQDKCNQLLFFMIQTQYTLHIPQNNICRINVHN